MENNSDFYLKPLNINANAGLATWNMEIDSLIHDLIDGYIEGPVIYVRESKSNKYRECKIVNENGNIFLLPGDGTKYSVKKITTNNRIESKEAEDNIDKCHFCNNEKTHIYVPCGHVVTCKECTTKASACPVCKKERTDIIRFFY